MAWCSPHGWLLGASLDNCCRVALSCTVPAPCWFESIKILVKYVGTWEVSHNVDSQCYWPHNPQDELRVWSLGLSPRLQCALNIPLWRGYMPISCLKNKGCGEPYTDIWAGEEGVMEWRLGPATLSKTGCHGDAFINLKTFFLKHSMRN